MPNILCRNIEEIAAADPEKPLFVFPETRRRPAETLTYGDLSNRAASAAKLFSQHASPGDRILISLPAGAAFWEAFFGCFVGEAVAVPLAVPNLNFINEHLQRVSQECTPKFLVGEKPTIEKLEENRDDYPSLKETTLVSPDDWRSEQAGAFSADPSPEAIAFLQYTSGSTAPPKGVQISHGNLIANLEIIRDRMEIEPEQQNPGVTWLPHHHDMGLIGGYLQPLFTRNTTWCLPPEAFVLQPAKWLQLISQTRTGFSGGPEFAYRMCVDRIKDEQLEGVDLSAWRVAYIGAERIRPETLRAFAQKFSPYGFRETSFFPCYGLGEATLMATGGPAAAPPVIRRVSASALRQNRVEVPSDDADAVEIVGSGRQDKGCDIAIVAHETGELLSDDRIGEVLISGPSITRGYFNRDDLNRTQFREIAVNGRSQQFLRTGDLGFLADGELFITGRVKDVIIIRGQNYYPEDLEAHVCDAHEALAPNSTAAFGIASDGEESFVIAAELRRTFVRMENPESVSAAIQSRIAESFGLKPAEILLLRPAAIPRTTSGKLKRFAVRQKYLDGDTVGVI